MGEFQPVTIRGQLCRDEDGAYKVIWGMPSLRDSSLGPFWSANQQPVLTLAGGMLFFEKTEGRQPLPLGGGPVPCVLTIGGEVAADGNPDAI